MNATKLTTLGMATLALTATAAWADTLSDHQATESTKVETAPCTTDLNGDGVTGAADLTQVLAAWGTCPGANLADGVVIENPVRPGPCVEDLTGDGYIGLADLNMLLAAWGRCDGVRSMPLEDSAAPSKDRKGFADDEQPISDDHRDAFDKYDVKGDASAEPPRMSAAATDDSAPSAGKADHKTQDDDGTDLEDRVRLPKSGPERGSAGDGFPVMGSITD